MCVAQVSQLIFNLMEANCPLDENIDSLETLEFSHPESNGDSEANGRSDNVHIMILDDMGSCTIYVENEGRVDHRHVMDHE